MGVSLAGLLVWAAVSSASTSTAPSRKTRDTAIAERTAKLLSLILPRAHLTGRDIDDALADDALDLYLTSLDYERAYFLASDVEAFRAEVATLDDQLRQGDLSFAFRVFDRFRERVEDRVAFAGRLLDEGFDLEVEESYRWRRKDAPWPADRAAWDELWRRRVKNEFVARRVVKLLDEEERQAKAADRTESPEEAAEAAADPDEALGAGDFVRKRYEQFLLVLKDADEQFVLDKFFNAFTQAYDPHSEYLSASRSEDFDINMKLSLVGIGALLSPEDGAAKIVRLIPGGPAERDGRLKPGDKIIAVAQGDEDAVDVLHWPLYKTVRLIRGEKGTRVVLTVWPASDPGGGTEERIDLVRDEVKLEEQAARTEVRDVEGPDGRQHTFGVLVLPEFYADFHGGSEDEPPRRAATDVRAQLEELKAKGIEGLVFDLRNNGGGSLADAISIAGLFIDAGPIVQVKDRAGIHVLSDPDPEKVYDGPVVVLVNRMSASASEIVAAALQDYARAVVVGDHQTHGKGTVQSLMPVDRRDPVYGSIKLTTASFYRIAGGSTQRRGVEADVELPSALDAMRVGEEYLDHALAWSSVDPAFYARTGGAPVEQLRERSAERRAADPRFAARRELLDRVSARLAADTIPLRLEERLAMARDERRLNELQQQMEDATRREEKGEGDDLVLEEAVRILADWTSIEEPAPPAVAAGTAAAEAVPAAPVAVQ